VNRSQKIGLAALGTTGLAAVAALTYSRLSQLVTAQAQSSTTQAQPAIPIAGIQVLLEARRRSTRRLVILANAIGVLAITAAIMFMVAILSGVGAAEVAPSGVASFVQRYASLTPALIDIGGVLLIARMSRPKVNDPRQSGGEQDWAASAISAIALYVVGNLLAYQSGKEVASAWYRPLYHATTLATINADNAVQNAVTWIFFVMQMKLVLDPPHRLQQWRRSRARTIQQSGTRTNSTRQATRVRLSVIASLAGIIPLLACVGFFVVPIALGIGATEAPKGFAAFVQQQASTGPALFGTGCVLAIALMRRYADNTRSATQEQHVQEEVIRSWALRLLATYAINPVGVWGSYTSAVLVARVYQQKHSHAAVTAVLNVDNLWQAIVGWLFFLLIPLIQVVLPAWNTKRRAKKPVAAS
jgi:hypothetical protein